MADNNQLVGKWYVADESAEQTEENSLQFYKDGSCLIPVNLLGEENEDYPMYFFYHAFENLTIKFDSGEAGIHMYRFVIEGDSLCLRKLNGEKFFFTKEEKKSKFKINPFEKIKQEKEAEQEKEEREPNENEWKCPTCGKINQNYVGTCGCGEARPEDVLPFVTYEMLPGQQLPTKEEEPVVVEEPEQEPEKQPEPEPEIEPTENEWKCPNCGTINQNYVGTCGCGEPRPADVSPFVTVELPPDVQKMVDAAEKAEEESRFAMEAAKAEEEAEKEPEPEIEPTENEWKCPNCGTINQNYVGTCGCGEARPADVSPFVSFELPPDIQKMVDKAEKVEESKFAAAETEEEPKEEVKAEEPETDEPQAGENEWKCPTCGKINQNYVGTCGCGQSKNDI